MESSEPRPDPVRVAVFAKAPVAGAVKTRLAPLLGPEGAARLHERLVHHALAAACDARVGPVDLWCAPDADHPFFADCARRYGAALRVQSDGTLGDRMREAFAAMLTAGGMALLVGSDCPALGAAEIRDAARALASHDAVFIPAEDGGYGLVGLSRFEARIFERIAWGGADVMESTRDRLRAHGLRWSELPQTWDVDRPEDYVRLRREGLLAGELA